MIGFLVAEGTTVTAVRTDGQLEAKTMTRAMCYGAEDLVVDPAGILAFDASRLPQNEHGWSIGALHGRLGFYGFAVENSTRYSAILVHSNQVTVG